MRFSSQYALHSTPRRGAKMADTRDLPPLLNQIIEALDEEHLRRLVYAYSYSVPHGPAEIVKAYADQVQY